MPLQPSETSYIANTQLPNFDAWSLTPRVEQRWKDQSMIRFLEGGRAIMVCTGVCVHDY